MPEEINKQAEGGQDDRDPVEVVASYLRSESKICKRCAGPAEREVLDRFVTALADPQRVRAFIGAA